MTYEALKALDGEAKVNALKELMKEYKTNKAIAEHLGANPLAISNMIKRYVEGKPIGRQKKTELQIVTASETPSNLKFEYTNIISGADYKTILNIINSMIKDNKTYMVNMKISEV
jgi:hypothetical protein